MKKLFSIVSVFTMFVSLAVAQNRTVSINVIGNRTKSVIVDGTTYVVNNTTGTTESDVDLSNLGIGSHSLEILRSNAYNNRTTSTTTNFNVRDGYDLEITIHPNGTVKQSETRSTGKNGNDRAMSTVHFNRLYNNTKAKTSSSARTTFLQKEFTNTTRGFTSLQARQLIQLVNSESKRFTLAKLIYLKVTDKANFSQVTTLLRSTANRNALNTYIASVDSDSDVSTSTGFTPMTSAKFNQVYWEVQAENTVNEKLFYLSNFFNKDFNYYTSAQARQLITLMTSEVDRMTLVKEAYRGITDRAQYYNEISGLLYSTVNRNELRSYIMDFDSNLGSTTTTGAMSTANFNTLYNKIYYTSGNTARYNSANNAFTTAGNYFTAAQARQLIELVSDENSRLALAKAAYNTLVDKSNYTVFNDLFNYQSSRNELSNYVLNNGSTTTPGAMTTASFNTLYNNIYYTNGSTARYNAINNAFMTTGNYFTAAQARQLIGLVTDESSRLALAKAAYNTLVDKTNYTVFNDLFNYQSSRNELSNYVLNNSSTTTTAMTTASFNTLYNNIYYTSGNTARYNAINNAFMTTGNYFTAVQAKQLIGLVTDENSRLTLAKAAYNTLVDKTNYTEFNDLFNYQSSRNELSNYVLNSSSTTTTAMTTASFNTLYNSIYYTNGNTARYNAINNAFITTGNYFTVEQGRQLIGLVTDENSRLALAKASFLRLVDKQNYTVYNDLFSYQSTRNDWNSFVQNNGNTGTTDPRGAMSDSEFNTLYNNVNSSWNAASKVSTLSTAFQSTTNYFTAYQVRQLLLLISAESDKLTLAKAAYDNLTDKYSYTQLYDVFSSTDSRNELARYVADIQAGGTGYSNRVAMSDADFKSIYRGVQFTFGFGAKYSSLTDIFNKETNYFTVSQAKQLIELVSAESNRLELSKLAWNNLTDPSNISLIYDVFSSQSSKDELASYIASNPYR